MSSWKCANEITATIINAEIFLLCLKGIAIPSSLSSVSLFVPPFHFYLSFHLHEDPQAPLLSKQWERRRLQREISERLMLHEIHPIVKSNRLFWIKAWDKILRSWWQKVPRKRFLESPSPITLRTLGQFGQSKIKVPLSPFFLFCPPIFFTCTLLCQNI